MYSFLFFVYLPATRNNSLLSFIQKNQLQTIKNYIIVSKSISWQFLEIPLEVTYLPISHYGIKKKR